MLFLYSMRTFETLAPKRFALVLICCATLSVSGQAQDAPMNAPEVMPVLNSCALIEDRTERETCSNQGIMEVNTTATRLTCYPFYDDNFLGCRYLDRKI